MEGSVQCLALTCPLTGLYGPEGILPARRTLRPQGKGRWPQLWETPTLLWETPLLGLDTAQGLELLSLLGTLLALGALLLHQLRHLLVYLLLWAAYLSAYQASEGCLLPPAPLGPLSPARSRPVRSPPHPCLCLACLCRHTPCSLTALLPAGGPGVSLFPVVSDYWVWGCRRLGGWDGVGCVCLSREDPLRGAALMGRRSFVLFFLPTGIPFCWRLASWPCWWRL